MNKLNLKDVTLICIDDATPKKASFIMEKTCEFISFADVKLFSSLDLPYVTNKIDPIINLEDYNIFVIKELYKHLNTEYCMFIQTDGYPLSSEAWTDEYYDYDYIGAPWTWVRFLHRNIICPTGQCVGNGGFSLRRTRLLEEVSKYDYEPYYLLNDELIADHSGNGKLIEEDTFICRIIDKELKAKGYKFAPCELASYFSVENKAYTGQFGFHGHETIKINQKMGIFKFKDHAYERYKQ